MIKEMVMEIISLKYVPCHRIKERSLVISGRQFPLCYRCMAILIGYVFLPVLLVYDYSFPLWLGMALNFPMMIDGTAQRMGIHMSNNFLRFWTGLLCGIGQSMLIIYISRILFIIIQTNALKHWGTVPQCFTVIKCIGFDLVQLGLLLGFDIRY
ncbi:DUF2085 domain-containing protein [Bacillus marasmi]|uniref:DUF2085 domain-containing protein n=1 Tax=Bacillus marasmi TaxID=1926279 RepID=UPI0011CA2BE5|nr:DUF2085 domain-containing protein [Bacillus marasmi]